MKNYCKLIFVIVFYCLFFFKINFVNGVEDATISEEYFTILSQMMVYILNSCKVEFNALIFNEYDDIIFQSLWRTPINTSVILYNKRQNSTEIIENIEIDAFVIITRLSPSDLKYSKDIFTEYQKTSWWNEQTPFFILYKIENGCKQANRLGRGAWKFNLLVLYISCFDNNWIPTIHTYNPYFHYAPNKWYMLETALNDFSGYTQFYRNHRQGDICDEFYFDRTKYLQQTKVKITMPLTLNLASMNYEAGVIYNEDMIVTMEIPQLSSMTKSMMQCLNISFELISENVLADTVSDPQRLFRRLTTALLDISLYRVSPKIGIGLSTTQASIHSTYYIITRHRGYQHILEKIQRYYRYRMFLLTFSILCMAIVAFMILTRKNFWYSVLESFCLMLDTSILTPLVKSSTRIFFSIILIYFLIFQATFKSKLLIFLIKKDLRDNVETLHDLKDDEYKSFTVTISSASIIEDSELIKKMIVVADPYECIQHVIKNITQACLEDYMYLLEASSEYDLHISKSLIAFNDYTYATRTNWPLNQRLDQMLQQIHAAGLSELWTHRTTKEARVKAATLSEITDVVVSKPLNIVTILFALKLLLVGLLISFSVFIFEVRIGDTEEQRKNRRRRAKRVAMRIRNVKPRKNVQVKKLQSVKKKVKVVNTKITSVESNNNSK